MTPPTHCADSVLAPASGSDDSLFMPLANINPRLGASQQGETARAALTETGAEPAFEELSEAGDPGGKPPPPVELEAGQLLDLRKVIASEGAAAVLFLCVLGQPLVWAHLNGFATVGLEVPPDARSTLMSRVRALVASLVTAFHVAFMLGRYASGLSFYAAPVDFEPDPATICRSGPQRRRWLHGGATLAWCTLAALWSTELHDPASRAFATADMFRCPVRELADAPSTSHTSFKFGASVLTSVSPRPAAEAGGLAWASI